MELKLDDEGSMVEAAGEEAREGKDMEARKEERDNVVSRVGILQVGWRWVWNNEVYNVDISKYYNGAAYLVERCINGEITIAKHTPNLLANRWNWSAPIGFIKMTASWLQIEIWEGETSLERIFSRTK